MPLLIKKARVICRAWHMNPPEHAAIFYVDEKLPMRPDEAFCRAARQHGEARDPSFITAIVSSNSASSSTRSMPRCSKSWMSI